VLLLLCPNDGFRCVASGKFSAGILYPDEEVWRRRYRKFTDNQEAKEGGVLRAKRKFEGFVFDFMPNLRGAMANEFFVLKARMIGASLLPNALGRTDHPLDLFQLICFSHHVLCVHRLLILVFSFVFVSPEISMCPGLAAEEEVDYRPNVLSEPGDYLGMIEELLAPLKTKVVSLF
jgi:hypothetical protein